MKIFRYIVDCYLVPQNLVDKNGALVGCVMDDIKRDYVAYAYDFSSTDGDSNSAFLKAKADMRADEGYVWIVDKVDRYVLDDVEKNLEFCEMAEINYPDFDSKHPDIWEYLYWVVDVLIREEFEETLRAIKNKDIRELIDGAHDISVLASNLPYKAFRKLEGLPPAQARANTKESYRRVVDSNLKKLDPGLRANYRKDGKVLKPSGWQPPSFEDLLTKK